LKKERDETLPKLQAERGENKEAFNRAKAALQTASKELQEAHIALSSESNRLSHAIGRKEQVLFESADPAIDEAITFFRDKLDWLRRSEGISRDPRGSERTYLRKK
jgi:cell division septum initiation protein DivIVA